VPVLLLKNPNGPACQDVVNERQRLVNTIVENAHAHSGRIPIRRNHLILILGPKILAEEIPRLPS
jgi:hypothetical protein